MKLRRTAGRDYLRKLADHIKGMNPRCLGAGYTVSLRRIFLFLSAAIFYAANGASGHAQPQSPRVALATRVDHAPKLDGTLHDPIWQVAQPIRNFHQREPFEGRPATESTEVRIVYTRRAVYFGIYCYSPEADRHSITATQLRRDVDQSLDDYFEIVIDSTHDRRNAYVFQVNPLGTQMDGLITEEQASTRYSNADFDPGWDGVWTSAAQITNNGWTATIEIPFSTLNFMKSTNVIWGINFKRFIRSKNEEDLWAAWPRALGITRISQAGEL